MTNAENGNPVVVTLVISTWQGSNVDSQAHDERREWKPACRDAGD